MQPRRSRRARMLDLNAVLVMEVVAWARVTLAVLVLAGSVFLVPASAAHACSWLQTVEADEPRDGDIGVPTNVVPWVRGIWGRPPTAWLQAGAERLDLTVTSFGFDGSNPFGVAELSPAAPLRAATTYEVHVALEGYPFLVMSFTIGPGPLSTPPPDPPVLRRAQRYEGMGSTCALTYACTSDPGGGTLELSVDGEPVALEDTGTLFRAGSAVPDECVELRRRDLAGRRSSPAVLCGSPVFRGPAPFIGADSPGLRCDDGRLFLDGEPLDDPGGCQTAPGFRAGGAGVLLFALVLLVCGPRGRSRQLRSWDE